MTDVVIHRYMKPIDDTSVEVDLRACAVDALCDLSPELIPEEPIVVQFMYPPKDVLNVTLGDFHENWHTLNASFSDLRDVINEKLDELKKRFPNMRSYGYKRKAKRFEDYLNLIDTVAEAIFTISGRSQLNYMMAGLDNRYWIPWNLKEEIPDMLMEMLYSPYFREGFYFRNLSHLLDWIINEYELKEKYGWRERG